MSEISFDESSSTRLLRMAKSSYGIGLAGEHHMPWHLHWGRPLDHQALSEIATELERSRMGDEEPLEPSALYRDLETGWCHLGAVLEEIGIHFPDDWRYYPSRLPPLLASSSSPRPRQATAAQPISGAIAPNPAGTTRVFRA